MMSVLDLNDRMLHFLHETKALFNRPVKVAVGLSGGVDSSVSAYILKELGFEVVGVHMQCWDYNLPGCKGNDDRRDAIKIASQLGISFKDLDFEKEYKEKVLGYFFDELKAGRTPNPDIMCNKEIKFGLFLNWAIKEGFDYIATGHYARIKRSVDDLKKAMVRTKTGFIYDLLSGIDESKDQSYFLYRLGQKELSHSLFPLGEFLKADVRKLATDVGLVTSNKPDSVGICFIGDIDPKKFIKEHVEVRPGPVKNLAGEVIGEHEGVELYTIGQRHGFTLTKYTGLPVYVVKKEASTNTLYVGFAKDTEVKEFVVEDLSFVGGVGDSTQGLLLNNYQKKLKVRIRNLGEMFPCRVFSEPPSNSEVTSLKVVLDDCIFGVAAGQSAVFYLEGVVVCGGLIH